MNASDAINTADATHASDGANATRPRLLIVYHTQSGNTGRLAAAVAQGAASEDGVEVVMKRAFDAGIDDLLACQGLLIGTPENFGALSGGCKDFLDRTYDAALGRTDGLPYAAFVSAGNDGSGAIRQLERIVIGYGWKRIAEPLIARGRITEAHLQQATELGAAMAAGLALGIF